MDISNNGLSCMFVDINNDVVMRVRWHSCLPVYASVNVRERERFFFMP